MAYPVWGRWKGGSQPFTSAIGDMRADRRSTNQKTSHSRSVFADLRSQPITMAAPVPMSVEAMQQLQQETAQRRQSLQQATTPASVESTPRYDVLSVDKLRELVRNVDPNERLDPEVENVLLQIADEFVDNVATFSCAIARHRKSSTLDAKDVQLYLDHSWNIRVPGYTSTLTPPMRFDTQQRSRLSQTRLAAVQSAASNPRKRKAPPRP